MLKVLTVQISFGSHVSASVFVTCVPPGWSLKLLENRTAGVYVDIFMYAII